MRFLWPWKDLPASRPGTIKCIPEDKEDIYALYSLIAPGDEVECQTIRKVAIHASSENSDMAKMRITLAVRAEKIDVDLEAAAIRINGKNVKENEWVKLGAYHSLDIEPGRQVKVTKSGGWDAVAKQILWQAGDPANKTEVGCVLLGDEGVAVLGSLPVEGLKDAVPDLMRVAKRVEVKQPKKKIGGEVERAWTRFLNATAEAMDGLFDYERLKAVIVTSPSAAARDSLCKHLMDAALKAQDRTFLDNKNKLLRLQLGTPEPSKLYELLKSDPRIKDILANTKSAKERKAIEILTAHLHDQSELSVYGLRHCTKAIEYGAVKTLLVSDSLFRSCNVGERKVYGRVVEDVKRNGGTVLITSAGSEPDRQLCLLTGIAATLTFPVVE